MSASLRLMVVLNAGFLLSALGCGDEGAGADGAGSGCGPAPEKKEAPAASGGGGGRGGGGGGANIGGPKRSADLITSDKKGHVPKAYQRPGAYDKEVVKSSATISKPIIAVVPRAPASVNVTKRRLDGIVDRVELTCKIMAASPDGQCSSAKNYLEIKERCCPGGLVERCQTTMGGVIIVGRGCEPAR